MYYLKTKPARVEMVLWFLVEGVGMAVLVRYTGYKDPTIARWLERMGRHSQGLHNVLFRKLMLAIVQLDELYAKVRDREQVAWLWLAIDPVTKSIPSLHLGERKSADAYAVVHDLKQRQVAQLDPWLEACATSDIAQVQSFAVGIRQDYAAIHAALDTAWSKGQTKGQVNRLKFIKRQWYGRAHFDLLRLRVLWPP